MSVRRLLVVIVLLVIPAALWVRAAERATFILTSGEQKSGILVAHGGQGNNLIDGYLNLGDGSNEQTFPQQQVAVIDFSGGNPPANELQALPGGSGQLLVLRSGQALEGSFDNIVNGDTVVWRNTGGQTQRYAARDVSRIYLNADASRQVFHYSPSSAPAAVATSGQNAGLNADVPAGAVKVDAKQPWTDTGITVRRGTRVTFRVNGGQVQFSPDPAHLAGADGNPAVPVSGLPVPIMGVGGLIGRVGNGPAFAIGNNTNPMSMETAGTLMLGVNDTDFGDNNGYYAVTISRRGL